MSFCSGSVVPALNPTSPNGISGTWSPTVIDNAVTGNYIFTPNAGICASVVTLTVNITDNTVKNESYYICFDGGGNVVSPAIIKTGLLPLQYSFAWSLGTTPIANTANSYTASVDGVYTVVATNLSTGCTITTVASVIPSLPATATATVGNDFDDVQQIVVNVIGGLGNYEYQLNNGPFQSSNIFNISNGGEYAVHVRDTQGCNNFELQVTALNYPKFFTPNGDGYNDTWNISGLPNPQNATVYIFDRYGKLVKHIAVVGAGWDGIYNEKPLPSTDYWFKLLYDDKNGISKEFKGHFSLKR